MNEGELLRIMLERDRKHGTSCLNVYIIMPDGNLADLTEDNLFLQTPPVITKEHSNE